MSNGQIHGVLQKDDNYNPVAGGVSTFDPTLVLNAEINPLTGKWLVEDVGGSAVTTTYIDLSSQTNGVTKTFTIPSGATALLLTGSDAPNVYRPVVDYTISGTTLTLLTDNAPSSGSTLILVYNPGANPPSGSEFTTVSPTESVNGSRTTFTFSGVSTQPLFIIIDNLPTRAISSLGTVNWTWNSGTSQATLTVTPVDDVVAITSSTSSVLTSTETVNGIISTFTFAGASSQPWAIIADNVLMQAVANDGTVNWTWNSGTKKATMTSTPQDDIVALSAPSTGVIQASELVNGVTSTFTFASAAAQPSFVVVDGGMERAMSSAGTVNWTWNSGTLQATLTVKPNDDVFALV